MSIVIRSRGHQRAQDRHTQSVQQVITQVKRTRTGKIVLKMIEAAPYDVIIEPNTAADGANNAAASPAANVHAGNTRLGTSARGTRAMVEFSTHRLRPHGVQASYDEVLLHELCHSLRMVYGRERHTRSGDPLPMGAGFGDVEEFFAIMVTNVHSSELGRAILGNHGAWPLPSVERLRQPPFNTRLRDFRVSMPILTRDLAAIPAEVAGFNPFRDVA